MRGLGAGECPSGYTFDGAQCQPDAYDCTTPSGARGKLNASGGCDYLLQPAPYLPSKPTTTTTVAKPATNVKPASSAAPVMTKEQRDAECRGLYGSNSASILFNGVWSCNVCGKDEQIDPSDGMCACKAGLSRQVPGDGTSPCVSKSVQPPSKADRDAECRKYYGANSGAIFYNGIWNCNVCGADEVIDPSDNLCMCKQGTVRKVPGDTMSPCVPKVNPQPPPAQAGFDLKPLAVVGIGIAAAALLFKAFSKDKVTS